MWDTYVLTIRDNHTTYQIIRRQHNSATTDALTPAYLPGITIRPIACIFIVLVFSCSVDTNKRFRSTLDILRWTIIWWIVCQKQVSRARTNNYIPHYLCGVITNPWPYYLLLYSAQVLPKLHRSECLMMSWWRHTVRIAGPLSGNNDTYLNSLSMIAQMCDDDVACSAISGAVEPLRIRLTLT